MVRVGNCGSFRAPCHILFLLEVLMIAKSSKCSPFCLQSVGQWGKVEDFGVHPENGPCLKEPAVCDYPRNCQV